MNWISVCRIIILVSISGMPLAKLYAVEKDIELATVKTIHISDSIPNRKGVDKKDQDTPANETKPADNTIKDVKQGTIRSSEGLGKDNQRLRNPNIKQVPRSIPKLKPKTLNDRIPIKRIPMNTPKKGFSGFIRMNN
jgi:hypothetical protein